MAVRIDLQAETVGAVRKCSQRTCPLVPGGTLAQKEQVHQRPSVLAGTSSSGGCSRSARQLARHSRGRAGSRGLLALWKFRPERRHQQAGRAAATVATGRTAHTHGFLLSVTGKEVAFAQTENSADAFKTLSAAGSGRLHRHSMAEESAHCLVITLICLLALICIDELRDERLRAGFHQSESKQVIVLYVSC